jgi:hypothetical protein
MALDLGQIHAHEGDLEASDEDQDPVFVHPVGHTYTT